MESMLVSLPSELLLLIAAKVQHQRDLNALAQTCRRLYGILNETLYQLNVRQYGSSALVWAARNGLVATVRQCLAAGADTSRSRERVIGNQVSAGLLVAESLEFNKA
jgi:hypothetical protein